VPNLKCSNCKKKLSDKLLKRPNRKFCQVSCRKDFYKKSISNPEVMGLNTSKIGQIHEMLVCIDLLKKKFEVFRQVGSNANDLVACKNNKIFRIEVTTGCRLPSGKLIFPPKVEDKFDVLAVVERESINYFPPIETEDGK
jgi:predicted AAA+ superfamily ATPase